MTNGDLTSRNLMRKLISYVNFANFVFWKSDYKSMSFEQLMTAKMPIGLSQKERIERMAFIAQELQIKGARRPREEPSEDYNEVNDFYARTFRGLLNDEQEAPKKKEAPEGASFHSNAPSKPARDPS